MDALQDRRTPASRARRFVAALPQRQDSVSSEHLVPIGQDQPGDLVFWSSNGSEADIHHVAIIWSTSGKPDDRGKIIEAQDFNVPVHIRTWRGSNDSVERAARPIMGVAALVIALVLIVVGILAYV